MNEPKLRFKADDGNAFPDWEEKKLGEIATRATRKNKDNVTDIPLTISSADGLIDQRDFFNKVVASKDMSGYYLLNNGEFAYNKSYSKGYDFGSIKRLDLYDCGALSTLYICFTLDENENSDFYQKYFDSLSWYAELQKICAEGARNHGLLNVPTNDFFQLKLRVPSSKDEQQKIADFLSTIDTVIAKQKETVSAWEERKKGVMQKLFSQEVRFKADDGSQFPEWEEKKIGDVFHVTRGYVLPVKDTKEIADDEYKYPVYSSQTKNNGLMGFYNQKLYENAITWTTDGANAGKTLYRQGAFYCTNVCGVLIDEKGNANNCIANMIDRISKKHVSYVGNPKLMNNVMSEIKLAFPCLAEQRKIADCLSSFDEVIEKQKATLSAWEELKKGLLQQMFV